MARVARFKQEIKIAQREATGPSLQAKPKVQVKRTFLRPVRNEEEEEEEEEDEGKEAMRAMVAQEVLSILVTCQLGDPCGSPYFLKAIHLESARLETAMAVTQNPSVSLKRKAARVQLFDKLERTASAKVAK